MKIISHWISKQTLVFQAWLPTRQNGVENRDQAYLLRLVTGFTGVSTEFLRTRASFDQNHGKL